jgi:hypothetical protein
MKKNIFIKAVLFAALFIFSFTHPFYAADKKAVILPLSYTGDPSKAYIADTVKKLLSTRLAGDGILIIEEEKLSAILNEKEKSGNIQANRIREIAAKINSDFALYGNVTTAGMTSSLDLFILDVNKKNVLPVKISDVATEDQLIVKTADLAKQIKIFVATGQFPVKGKESDTEKANMQARAERQLSSLKITNHFSMKKTQVMSFDIADLNGDGSPEWIVLEEQVIKIFSRENDTILEKDSLKTDFGEIFLKVSAGDADGNGKPEIYIITLYGSVIRTCVWEWQGKFNRLFNISGNVRILKDNTFKKPALLFQESKGKYPFTGTIYTMQYNKDNKLERKEPLKDLENVQFCTLMIIDINKDGKMEYVGLDNNSLLCVWDINGEFLWKSKDEMGGTNNYLKQEASFRPGQPGDAGYAIPLNSRLVVMDIDRDGQNEIICARNIPSLDFLQNWKTYTKGNIFVYKIDSKNLVSAWISEEIGFCINDIQTDGWTLYLAGQEKQALTIFKGTSRIMWFE